MTRSPSLTWREYRNLFDELSDVFLADKQYWRIEGRPVCSFLNLSDFVAKYAMMIRFGSKIVERKVGIAPYVLGIIGQADNTNLRFARELPLDGITGYGLLPNWCGDPIQNYRQLIEQRVAEWEYLQRRLAIPFYPVVSAGWDATSRGAYRTGIRSTDRYPYLPVVQGVTAELFGSYLDLALEFNERWQPRDNIIFLHAWNEWSESSAIEPSDTFGSTLLEEVAKRQTAVRLVPLRSDNSSHTFAATISR
jgi:hypothetical protein